MRRPSDSSREEEGDGRTKFSKGPWTADEDRALIEYMVGNNGKHHNWQRVPMLAGINRCGKSCRLRWTNYLRPGLNRSAFTDEEDMIITNLHSIMGNRWAAIARALPGRTDNDIKNHWNTFLGKKLLAIGIDPRTHSLLPNDLHPDFIRLQADLANFFGKLNSRVASHSALHALWPNNAAMTTPLQEGAFQSYTGGEYVLHDGKVDLQQLGTISPPCSDVSPNILASTNMDVTMAITEPDAGSTGNWWTFPVPLNELPANLAASRLSPKCCRSMSRGDAVITESTVSSQFVNIDKAGLCELENDSDEFWNNLLNY